MKSLIAILLLTPALVGLTWADDSPRPNIRVWVQHIALPHTLLTTLLSDESTSDSTLHQQLLELSKTGKAEILETSMVGCGSGFKSTVESIREEIYPTEYDPPCIPTNIPEGGVIPHQVGFNPVMRSFPAFETRNTGVTLEIQPSHQSDAIIDLRLVPEIIQRLRYEVWFEHQDQWGKVDFKFPIYETWRSNSALPLKSGKFALLSIISPKRKLPTPFEDSRVLVFVRADLMTMGPTPLETEPAK